MSDPITRPGELARIANNEIEYRVKVMSDLEIIKEHNKRHEAEDDRRFDELSQRIGVYSRVGDNGIENQFKGAKFAITGLISILTLFSMIGGFVWWIVSMVKTP